MEQLTRFLFLGFGGFLGTLARYAVISMAAGLSERGFPAGTMIVNLVGSFTIGFVVAMLTMPGLTHPNLRLFLIVGVLGGFTTYSSFSLDLLTLIREGKGVYLLGYSLVTLFGGVLLTGSGLLTGNWLLRKLLA